jgi:hypothetical protein
MARKIHQRPQSPRPKLQPRLGESVVVVPFRDRFLTDYDCRSVDPGRAPDAMQDFHHHVTDKSDTTLHYLPSRHRNVRRGPFVVPDAIPLAARSRDDLYRNLLSMLQTPRSPPPLSNLIFYHNSQPPQHRSAKTYNCLIGLAIEQTAFGTAQELLQEMAVRGVLPNQETSRLVMRYYVRIGQWERAYHQVLTNAAASRGRKRKPIPVRAWLELFGTEKRGARRLPLARRTQPCGKPLPPNPEYLPKALAAGPPPSRESTRLASQVLYMVSRALVWAGETEAALQASRDYFTRLPKTVVMDSSWHRRCMRIIHLFARLAQTVNAKKAVNTFYRACKVVDSLMKTHPSLRANSTTLFLLLGNLRRADKPSVYARQLVTRYKQRFGPGVADSRVQWRLASYFVKDHMLEEALHLIKHHKHERSWLAQWKVEREVVGGPDRVAAPVRHFPHDLPTEGRRPRIKKWPRISVYRKFSPLGTRWRTTSRRFHQRSETPAGTEALKLSPSPRHRSPPVRAFVHTRYTTVSRVSNNH